MDWLNFYGLAIMTVIMLPNLLYVAKHKRGGQGYRNRAVETLEQIGRYGCFALMLFNFPYVGLNFWFRYGQVVYLSVNGVLCLAYILLWGICWNKTGKLKALSLSVIPSCIFLFSGIVTGNLPLMCFAVVFACSHIRISYQNRERT